MKCYANKKDGGVCVSRQGKTLSQKEYDDIHSLHDKDVCRFKEGHLCMCAEMSNPIKNTHVEDEKAAEIKSGNFDSFFE